MSDDFAYSRWSQTDPAGIAAHTVPVEFYTSEQPIMYTTLTVTYGETHVQTSSEPTSFDTQGRTLISIHFMLAAEQQHRPCLTLQKLGVELTAIYEG